MIYLSDDEENLMKLCECVFFVINALFYTDSLTLCVRSNDFTNIL